MTAQLDFEAEARARATDPDTSHVAAASIDRLRERQQAVLDVLVEYGPMTDTDLIATYQAIAEDGKLLPQSESGIRTRRNELVVLGRVENTGRRALLASGRPSIVWHAIGGT